MSGLDRGVDRVALEILLDRPELPEAARRAAEGCVAAGATAVRVRVAGVTSEVGVLPDDARTYPSGPVEIGIAGPVDATDLARALAIVAERADVAATRRKALHDVRGLLAIVSGQTEMLSMSVWGPINAAQAKALETIGRQLERLGPLLERLRS